MLHRTRAAASPSRVSLGLVTMASLCAAIAFGQEQGAPLPPAATETIAPNIPGVVKGGTRVQVVVDGLKHTDGPAAMPDGTLLYWDFMDRRIGKIDPQGRPSTFLSNTDGSSAIGFDSKGRLITTLKERPPVNKIGAIWPKASEAILADSFDGKPFEGPNDLVVDKHDGVYFTLSGSGTVLYLRPGGKVIKVFAHPVERINGVTLSPDEKTLYVATQSRVAKTRLSLADLPKEGGEYILAFDVRPDGTVTNQRNFARYEIVTERPNGTPDVRFGGDGLAIDAQGRLYAATAAGIQVFSPRGQHLGTIPVSKNPNNLAFAGPDRTTLYIVARGAVYRVPMLAEGYKGRAK
ncbi:MAG: SMP-30/gluconolactonase/LRE family protein [Acidobacteria bacterium]|nr:SMP-30/gluconolactonase/LRE family protein [Acidobacteriota bacterium]